MRGHESRYWLCILKTSLLPTLPSQCFSWQPHSHPTPLQIGLAPPLHITLCFAFSNTPNINWIIHCGLQPSFCRWANWGLGDLMSFIQDPYRQEVAEKIQTLVYLTTLQDLFFFYILVQLITSYLIHVKMQVMWLWNNKKNSNEPNIWSK